MYIKHRTTLRRRAMPLGNNAWRFEINQQTQAKLKILV